MDWDLVDAWQPLSIFTFFATSPKFMVVLQRSPLSLDFIPEPFVGINYDGDLSDQAMHPSSLNTSMRMVVLTDAELDEVISEVLRHFLDYGWGMIFGALVSKGLRVSRERVDASHLRVQGPPPPFRQRTVARNSYRVPGANSVWHHDGNHTGWQQAFTLITITNPLVFSVSFWILSSTGVHQVAVGVIVDWKTSL
ncbi:hypothetical protein EDD18DRAFT_1115087 [Armillaria luteobubalina]|uniref:Uncharacterized protein n=1 Tax=Armillaria luteobubalina TaxID=153913 RepID=A0AA39P3Q0_9AGAR|nr:hypothetical protein EDD18DRAFT_1115087 [Armillaria luteobubalina]